MAPRILLFSMLLFTDALRGILTPILFWPAFLMGYIEPGSFREAVEVDLPPCLFIAAACLFICAWITAIAKGRVAVPVGAVHKQIELH